MNNVLKYPLLSKEDIKKNWEEIQDRPEFGDFLHRLLGLRKLDLDTDLELLLEAFNGFNKEGNEFYLSNEKELLEFFKKYDLDINKIFIENNPNKFMMITDLFVYVEDWWTFRFPFTDNAYISIEYLKGELDKYRYYFKYGYRGKLPSIYTVPQRFQISIFNFYADYMQKDDRVNLCKDLFKTSDYGSSNLEFRFIEEAFEDSLKELDKFKGEYLDVYRGVGSKSKGIEGYSWSLDYNIAKFFATRFAKWEKNKDDMKIYKYRVHKSCIVGYIGGKEKEIILNIDPEDYEQVEVLNVEV